MAIQNFFTSRDNKLDGNTYVGQLGRLWYNPDTNSIYASDGSTVGGIPIDLATGANIVANNITVNRVTSTSGTVSVTGNLAISGNISPAAVGKIGGITPGPGVFVGNTGILTIDSANLPVSFGNFTANNNVLTIVNLDEDMILQTQGSAEIQLIGNVGFYKPDGLPPNTANRYFQATDDGQVKIFVPDTDPTTGAVEIIGTSSGLSANTVNTGVMLHITGQNGIPSRLYNDGVGNFAAFVGRRINGSIASPSPVVAGDELIRISSTGYNGTEISGSGSARIVFQAIENFTVANTGSNLSFWTAAVGSNVLTKIATADVANGFSATKFNTAGDISAAGNITGGNLVLSSGGLISSTGLISTTGNVAAGNVNSYVTLPAGTTTKAPLVFTAGNVLATPSPGAVNFDGRVFYATPQGQERGLIRTAQTYVLNADYTLTDQTAVQSMFGVSAAVSSNTRYAYLINAVIYKTANNITMSYAIDGGAALARHTYQTTTTASAGLATLSAASVLKNILTTGFGTGVVVTSTLNGTGYYSIQVIGLINVTTGGTRNPLIGFSGLPGAGSYVASGSSVEIYPVGPGNATVSIGNWT